MIRQCLGRDRVRGDNRTIAVLLHIMPNLSLVHVTTITIFSIFHVTTITKVLLTCLGRRRVGAAGMAAGLGAASLFWGWRRGLRLWLYRQVKVAHMFSADSFSVMVDV